MGLTYKSLAVTTASNQSARFLIVALLMTHAGLLAFSATKHSPTLNEPAHLVAGLSHLETGCFDLYKVNPPLVRTVAATPLLFTDAAVDWTGFFDFPGARPVFKMGTMFMEEYEQSAMPLFVLARLFCIPFSILGAVICYRWANDLYGPPSGLLAISMWCFSPNIIAHGQCITPDCGATALGLTASYLFWKWLKTPSICLTVYTGIGMGLALLAKSTWITLFILWPVSVILWQFGDGSSSRLNACKRVGSLFFIFSVGLYVLNLGYGFEQSFYPLNSYRFVSKCFTDFSNNLSITENPNSYLGRVPIPLPKNFVLGLDLQKKDFEDFGRDSYLRGEFRNNGWVYYYMYAILVKVPLGSIALVFMAVWYRLKFKKHPEIRLSKEEKEYLLIRAQNPSLQPILKPRKSLGWSNHSQSSLYQWITKKIFLVIERDDIVLLLTPLAIFFLASIQTGINHHLRYVLPCFPFCFVFAGQSAQWMVKRGNLQALMTLTSFLGMIASSMSVYPHCLSYFNELAGGATKGHYHLLNSNIDWGQDLLYLKDWIEQHPEARPMNVCYYGIYGPECLGVDFPRPPVSNRVPNYRPPPGWYAVSVNYLKGYEWRAPKYAYSYFEKYPPVSRAGYSIYIYHIK